MKNIIFKILTLLHLKSVSDVKTNIFITVGSFFLAYFKQIIMDNINLFISVTSVIMADWILGTIIAVKNKNWVVSKAFMLIWYLVGYNVCVYIVLSIEKGSPEAFFLSETVVTPILIFQVISFVKKLSILKIFPQGLLLEILEKIDSHKNINKINTEP